MKKIFAFGMLALMAACNSRDKKTEIPAAKEFLPNGYIHLEGTVGNEQTLVNLLVTESGVRGSYTVNGVGNLMHLFSLGYSQEIDSVLLMGAPYGANVQEDTFKLVYKDGVLSGSQIAPGGRRIPVSWKSGFGTGTVALDYGKIKDSLVTSEGAAAYIFSEYFTPASTLAQPLRDSLNRWLIKAGLPEISITETDMVAAERYFVNDYINEFKTMVEKMREEGETDMSRPTFQYNHTRSMYVHYNNNDILSVSNYIFDFSGGAHPNHATYFNNYDLTAGKRIVWEDVFSVPKSEMGTLMAAYFRKARGMQEEEPLKNMLFESQIFPNDNFYVTGGGIGFWYIPYEVAAYVYGDTEVFIPYSALNPYLQKDFKTRMGINP